jgi:NitT/TauT family transport system substrate-binding protein
VDLEFPPAQRVAREPGEAQLTRLFALTIALASALLGADKPQFIVGWSVYVGYTPVYYMAKQGLLKKWGDKYGVTIKAQRFDYGASLDAFVAKNIDACLMTNMEALDMPAAAGIDTSAIILDDYSNGNDAVLTRNGLGLKDLPGRNVLLVEKTISQYLFERAMALNGLASQISRVHIVNTSDADIAGAFLADTSQNAVVTWKPMVSQIRKSPGITSVFDSSKLPGEIMDITVVRTETLNRSDGAGQRFAKALVGAWYETMALMLGKGPAADQALTRVAEGSQDTLESYKEQLATTRFLGTPQAALDVLNAPDFKQKMTLVSQFCHTHGLVGGGHGSTAEDVAIRYSDGTVEGNPKHVRMRFDSSFTLLAAQGKL